MNWYFSSRYTRRDSCQRIVRRRVLGSRQRARERGGRNLAFISARPMFPFPSRRLRPLSSHALSVFSLACPFFNACHVEITYQAFNPLISLSLRINEQRPPLRILHSNTILDGECVSRQTGNLPVTNLNRITKRCYKITVVRMRNFQTT